MMRLYLQGKTVQYLTSDGWYDCQGEPSWVTTATYRVKPKTPLQIPWDLIDEKYQWAAKDEDGGLCFYEYEPRRRCHYVRWEADEGDAVDASFLVNLDPDGIPWEESLVQRPSK
jgi:hypothetical protein